MPARRQAGRTSQPYPESNYTANPAGRTARSEVVGGVTSRRDGACARVWIGLFSFSYSYPFSNRHSRERVRLQE